MMEHKLLYASTIEGAISKHMIPLRLDILPNSEAIYTSFAEAVRTASAVMADITLLNENVMYEIGYAHGLGLVPLIYTREAYRLNDLPVYFRTLNVRLATPGSSSTKKSIRRGRCSYRLPRYKKPCRNAGLFHLPPFYKHSFFMAKNYKSLVANAYFSLLILKQTNE
jgi:hypothetical protein